MMVGHVAYEAVAASRAGRGAMHRHAAHEFIAQLATDDNLFLDMDRFPWPGAQPTDADVRAARHTLVEFGMGISGRVPEPYSLAAWLDAARVRSHRHYRVFSDQGPWTRAVMYRDGYLSQIVDDLYRCLEIAHSVMPHVHHLVERTYVEAIEHDSTKSLHWLMELPDPAGFHLTAIHDLADREHGRPGRSLDHLRPADE